MSAGSDETNFRGLNRANSIRSYDIGCYVSERSWGTVREDKSPANDPWTALDFFKSKDHPYVYGEDAIAGLCDFRQNFVFSFAFWNTKDRILKEKLFGVSNHEGNHGEDVKELYYHLECLKDHSYVEFLYKYPVSIFPYEELILVNQNRSSLEREYEIYDTKAFDEGYFDIKISYAKIEDYDIAICLEVTNRSHKQNSLCVIPQVWFRNRWTDNALTPPVIYACKQNCLKLDTTNLLPSDTRQGQWKLPNLFLFSPFNQTLFTENEEGKKGAFHEAIIQKQPLNNTSGTKGCFFETIQLEPNENRFFYFRLKDQDLDDPLVGLEEIFYNAKKKSTEFYDLITIVASNETEKQVIKGASSGLLYSKTYYEYSVKEWIRKTQIFGRNKEFYHFKSYDILSLPDKWEYPWFAAWDLAFQTISFGYLDLDYGKKMAWFLLSDRIMHPNGMLAGYEWEFSSVNPPVNAFSILRLYRYEKDVNQIRDVDFLKKCFDRLTIHFTWWVNRKDVNGLNVFEGGFCGLDNISVLDRQYVGDEISTLEQSDTTSWMALFSLVMMRIALEIAVVDPVYEIMASKYFRHFCFIATGFSKGFQRGLSNWCDEDSFFYDVIKFKDGRTDLLKIRSFVGIIPAFSFEWITDQELEQFKEFSYLFNRALKRLVEETHDFVKRVETPTQKGYLFTMAPWNKIERVLQKVFDSDEFLAPFGVRSLSIYHRDHPVEFAGKKLQYEPNESCEKIMGGNSNWRGPIWMPVQYMVIDLLLKIDDLYRDSWHLKKKDGSTATALELAIDLKDRLLHLFELQNGERPIYGGHPFFKEEQFNNYIQFFEYFNPETGQGLGASHQTGWTALIANIIIRCNWNQKKRLESKP
jgi:hypothetical protein